MGVQAVELCSPSSWCSPSHPSPAGSGSPGRSPRKLRRVPTPPDVPTSQASTSPCDVWACLYPCPSGLVTPAALVCHLLWDWDSHSHSAYHGVVCDQRKLSPPREASLPTGPGQALWEGGSVAVFGSAGLPASSCRPPAAGAGGWKVPCLMRTDGQGALGGPSGLPVWPPLSRHVGQVVLALTFLYIKRF